MTRAATLKVRVKLDHMRKMKFTPKITLLILVVLVYAMGSASLVCAKETTLAEISTKAGRVLLSQRDKNKVIIFNGKTIYTGSDEMKIYHFFRPRKEYDALLLKDFKGPIYCPVTYQFIIFKPDETYSLPEPFGHCSHKPDMSQKGTIIKIRFKPFAEMPGAEYIFDGKTLQKSE
jgi:hypothetical protein